MSVSVALQDFIAGVLKSDPAVTAIVGQRVYDGAPTNARYPYISFGASDTNRVDADCIPGRDETLQIDCWSSDQGKTWPCKKLVDAIEAALRDQEGDLAAGALVSLNVVLTRCFIDRDDITAHGVVQVTAEIEDPRS